MQSIKIDLTIYTNTKKSSWDPKFETHTIPFDSEWWDKHEYYIKIAPYTIEIEVPDDIDRMIYEKTLVSLQLQRKLILSENEQRINRIEQQIQEHLAIEA